MEPFEALFPDPYEDLLRDPVPEDGGMLVLHFTEYCNAECDHCIVEMGPRRKERLTKERALELVAAAASLPDIELLVVTGGENFVREAEVLELAAFARGRGLATRVVSNAFWARTPERAARTLERCADAGVEQLAISFDEFHLPFIPAECVRNVHLGAREASRVPRVFFHCVIDPTPESARELVVAADGVRWPAGVARLLATYGFEPGECVPSRVVQAQIRRLEGEARRAFKDRVVRARAIVHWDVVAVGGRASRTLAGRYPRRPLDEDAGPPCGVVGRQVTIPADGRLFPCCSLWSNFKEHAFGPVDPDRLPEQVVAMRADPLVRVIAEHGPGALLRFLRGRGEDLPGDYSDICNMCEALFRARSIDELRQAAGEFDAANPLVGILDPGGWRLL